MAFCKIWPARDFATRQADARLRRQIAGQLAIVAGDGATVTGDSAIDARHSLSVTGESAPDRATDFSAINIDFIAIAGDIPDHQAFDQADAYTAGAAPYYQSIAVAGQRQMEGAGNDIAIQFRAAAADDNSTIISL